MARPRWLHRGQNPRLQRARSSSPKHSHDFKKENIRSKPRLKKKKKKLNQRTVARWSAAGGVNAQKELVKKQIWKKKNTGSSIPNVENHSCPWKQGKSQPPRAEVVQGGGEGPCGGLCAGTGTGPPAPHPAPCPGPTARPKGWEPKAVWAGVSQVRDNPHGPAPGNNPSEGLTQPEHTRHQWWF